MNNLKNRFIKKYGNYIILFFVLLIFFIQGQFKKRGLKECHKFATGKINAIFDIGSAPNGTNYIYKINGVEYESLITGKYYYGLVNKKFPVIYKCDEPDFSKILIEPDDFKEFGYKYPDSLKWVLKYIENKQ